MTLGQIIALLILPPASDNPWRDEVRAYNYQYERFLIFTIQGEVFP